VGEGVTVSLFPHAEIPKMIAVNVNIYSQARKFGLAVYYHSLKASTARESVVEDISKLEAEDLDYFSLLIIRRAGASQVALTVPIMVSCLEMAAR